LSTTFAKYLEQYAQQVLYYLLSEKSGAQGPSIEDAILILNTADYCYATCNQLEEKIKGRIDEELREKVDLQSQADAFMGIASATVRILVRKVEIACEPSWREMRNTPWAKLESVGDQSTYVSELLKNVKETSGEILKYLHKQQYARAFCDNLVDLMASTYIANIVQCKPIAEAGAEQMLLDSYVLKKGFTELPTLNEEPGTAPPSRYIILQLSNLGAPSGTNRLKASSNALRRVCRRLIPFLKLFRSDLPLQKHWYKLTSSTSPISRTRTFGRSWISKVFAKPIRRNCLIYSAPFVLRQTMKIWCKTHHYSLRSRSNLVI
jgi:hypothetical protein